MKGKILIGKEALAKIAGIACSQCYGVIAMAKRTPTDFLNFLSGKDKLTHGVIVRFEHDKVHLILHVVLLYGVKISEVMINIREQVKYKISDMTHLDDPLIDVFVTDVKVLNQTE